MEKETLSFLMETSTKGIGNLEKCMAGVHIVALLDKGYKEFGNMEI